ncbi:MAG: M28 family metallopeptidase [Oscillospiraceae bacterium]|nr:M28 family metallopeptidase [Oscillospiraceae bacterium]MCL2279997.1 M28 family metallopeptidase [Oscillospiraceae bacterium]
MITIRILKFIIILLLTILMVTVLSACASAPEDSYGAEPGGTYAGTNEVGYETELSDSLEDLEISAGIGESFHTGLPHGYIAVDFIRHMNDNFPGRSPFTYREQETAVWIVEELLAMGHNPDNIEVQEFTFDELVEREIGSLLVPDWDFVSNPLILGAERLYLLRQDRGSQNVILTLPGQSDRKIIVGAHYDSVPYPGASDNASGTALLLESSLRMLEIDHYHTIVYVFFGAEEVGLFGAYYYYESLTAEEHANVVMMINADILIDGPYIIYGAGTASGFAEDTFEAIVDSVVLSIVEEFLEESDDVFQDTDIEEWAIALAEHFAANPTLTLVQGFMEGLVDAEVTDASLQVDALALELSETHGLELLAIPEGIAFTSDNLVFFMSHTVVNLIGLERVENIDGVRIPMGLQVHPDFAATILHTPYDEFDKIEYLWPGMMLANMNAFSLFLEAILSAVFS